MIRAILVDDELGAIKNLQLILNEHAKNLEIIGYATSSKDAELKIKMLKPDVLFLDIEMPQESGIDFLKRIQYYDCEIVFVTAYSEYAIQAFKLNAIDYILKPISIKEIIHCVDRLNEIYNIKQNFRETLLKERLNQISLNPKNKTEQKIILKNKDSVVIVLFEDIISLNADGAYTEFHYLLKGTPKKSIMSYPLAHYEDILPSIDFLRVHKSFIVNKKYIDKILREPNYVVLTIFQAKIPISKRRVKDILQKL